MLEMFVGFFWGFFLFCFFSFAFFSGSVVYLICLVLALPLPTLSSSFRLSFSTLDKYVLNDWTSAALSGVSWRSVKDWESVPETHTKARPTSKLNIVLSASFITGTVIGLKRNHLIKQCNSLHSIVHFVNRKKYTWNQWKNKIDIYFIYWINLYIFEIIL